MSIIQLKPLLHKNAEQIGIYFPPNRQVEVKVRSIKGISWSQTNHCWYLALTKDNYKAVINHVEGLAKVDNAELETFLEKRKTTAAAMLRNSPSPGKPFVKNVAWHLSAENNLALQKFIEQLKLKAYSVSTIRTYRNEFLQLLQVLKSKPVNDLTSDDLRRYMLYAMEKQGISENTAHSRLNALKFYFEQVAAREKFIWEIPRPKKADKLPRFFSKEEVVAIMNSVTNSKHKAMLMLAYGGGLRVGEIVQLKTRNIDSKRMSILIEGAKGKKDRIVGLSPVLLVMLRCYAKEYKPEKTGYLFIGQTEGQPYSARSLQQVIQTAKNKARVLKPGAMHGLRHSFATHLLDRGTDVTMIQKLLGHNNIKTTLRYLHTTNKDLLKVISPLDDLPLA